MKVETEKFGRYEIKSGPLKETWMARAFYKKAMIAEASAPNREEAVADLKQELERLKAEELSERDKEGAPSASVYAAAFSSLEPLHESYRAMLRAHLTAPDHLISASKLAEAAGYANWSAANLHYGKLGYSIADEIGFGPPKREDGTEIWTCAIARDPALDTEFPDTSLLDGLERAMADGDFEWQMRPQVVEALRSLGY